MGKSPGKKILFTPYAEVFQLWLPFVFICFSVLEIALKNPLSHSEKQWGEFVAKIILLNHTHIIFSFILVLFFPEFREWIKAKDGSRRINTWLRWALVLGSFWLLSKCTSTQWAPLIPSVAVTIMTAGLVAYAYHHNVAQTIALAQLYDAPTKDRRTEKFLILGSLFTVLIFLGLKALKLHIVPSVVIQLLPLVSLALAIANISRCFFLEDWQASNKLPFLFRTLLLPLSCYSSVALWGFWAAHGIEYALVFRKMYYNSKISEKVQWWVAAQMAFMAVVLLGIALFRYAPVNKIMFSILRHGQDHIKFLVGISVALSYMHYYLDRQMFRMREKSTRDHIGPLLWGKSTRLENREISDKRAA